MTCTLQTKIYCNAFVYLSLSYRGLLMHWLRRLMCKNSICCRVFTMITWLPIWLLTMQSIVMFVKLYVLFANDYRLSSQKLHLYQSPVVKCTCFKCIWYAFVENDCFTNIAYDMFAFLVYISIMFFESIFDCELRCAL